MKKIYLLSNVMLLSVAAFSQNSPYQGKIGTVTSKPLVHAIAADRVTSPDTTGIVNVTDFLPEFASQSGQLTIFGYSGGGYIYGNNKDGLNVCAQGYNNVSSPVVPVQVIGAIAWFAKKERDLAGAGASKVSIKLYAMADNKAYNTNGSGTFNQTTLNAPGPNGAAKASVDILYDDIDTTTFANANYVTFTTPASFTGDFAISMDATTLTAGDTVGLLSDQTLDAQNLDYTFHKLGTKWVVSDQAFSNAAAPDLGTGGLDNNIALFAVLNDATGVNEYFNGMKLTTYPNPAVEKATIEYTLEKNANNVSVFVFDKSGRRILEKNFNTQNAGTYKVDVETANLSAGTYLYQLNANGRNFTKQFVVTK